MKELALHLLDIAQNAVTAGAATLRLSLEETGGGALTLCVEDDGRGMPPELLARVTDPFVTSRTTRPVGLGLPLLRLAAEQTGGSLHLESEQGRGTRVTAVFDARHIDCPPPGDLAGAVATLIQGAPHLEVRYRRALAGAEFVFDTREVREALGPDIPLSAPEVFCWMRDHLAGQERALSPGKPGADSPAPSAQGL